MDLRRPRDEYLFGLGGTLSRSLRGSIAAPLVGSTGTVVGPVNTVAPVVSGTETVGETLSCTEGTWTGNGSITYAYQWRRSGADIGAATAATYELAGADEGEMISCRVTATDDDGSRGATSNSVGPVEAAAAEVWSGYFAAAGITNGTAQTAINTFYGDLTAALGTKVKVFAILMGETASVTNLMQDAFHGSLVNSPTFTAWTGVRPDGTTDYISTATALNAITGVSQNSLCIGGGVAVDNPGVGQFYGPNILSAYDTNFTGISGSHDGDDSDKYYASNAVNDAYGAGYNSGAAAGDLTMTRSYASRTGAAGFASYYNGAAIDTTSGAVASTGVPALPLFSGANNNGGSPAFNTADANCVHQWHMIAEGLSAGEIATLDALIVTLVTSLGAL